MICQKASFHKVFGGKVFQFFKNILKKKSVIFIMENMTDTNIYHSEANIVGAIFFICFGICCIIICCSDKICAKTNNV